MLIKEEPSISITDVAIKKAVKSKKSHEIIEYAILSTYGTSEDYLERAQKVLSSCK